jgi:SAM-dependent methyltransferase
MITKLKRYLASNKFFWKYRHILQKNIFNNSYGSVPINHFNSVFDGLSINSVLDFGCATGEKLDYFVKNGANYIYGIDINPIALSTAKKKLTSYSINCEFNNFISELNIINFLKKNKIKKFDLIFFDRVLYILDNKEFNFVLNIILKMTKYIYVDDFFLEKKVKKNSINRVNINGYIHTDFDEILKNAKFQLTQSDLSPYSKVRFANTKFALYELSE